MSEYIAPLREMRFCAARARDTASRGRRHRHPYFEPAHRVVGAPGEIDMALLLGLGFPAYAGGPLKLADWLGPSEVVARCERLLHLGAACEPTRRMREMAASGARFHTS